MTSPQIPQSVPEHVLRALVLAGARARVLGVAQVECPLLNGENRPAATGEPVEAWHLKVAAWGAGWQLEDGTLPGGLDAAIKLLVGARGEQPLGDDAAVHTVSRRSHPG